MPIPLPVQKCELLEGLPAPWPEDLLPRIQDAVTRSGCKVVVLDDDPTGTQTVHGIPVLTHWAVDALSRELQSEQPAVYILTNSRSLPPLQAQRIAAEIACNLETAGRRTKRRFAVVSRGDSTLRGHFPEEVAALAASLDRAVDGWILCPLFEEGGRYTIGDVHFVQQEETLIPAGETEFARDAAFGYRSSNLRRWVEEKSAGRIRAQDTISISIDDIRLGGPGRVEAILAEVTGERVCVVNAAAYRDLEVFVLGLLAAESSGKKFLYRTAASFVRVRAGLPPRSLLSATDLKLADSGAALVVVGSHVPKTTAQLERLLAGRPDMVALEVDVVRLLDDALRWALIKQTAASAEAALQQGRIVVIFTSRKRPLHTGSAADLAAGRRISRGLVSILKQLETRPRYILAKGGITSSDIATQALNVERAVVAGQIAPGVPVWELGPESRFPGCPYVVFPGNVGEAKALLEAVERLDSR
jgi:uncharacterized protein YgbK (DUF1537 family)